MMSEEETARSENSMGDVQESDFNLANVLVRLATHILLFFQIYFLTDHRTRYQTFYNTVITLYPYERVCCRTRSLSSDPVRKFKFSYVYFSDRRERRSSGKTNYRIILYV